MMTRWEKLERVLLMSALIVLLLDIFYWRA
jgi:hypothetical protein